ncbi:MAG: hypothetical protein K5989_02390 [Lachnospiraceae bacterium]|nr:hypothetical protein [Lachnospiraceae bacterium]
MASVDEEKKEEVKEKTELTEKEKNPVKKTIKTRSSYMGYKTKTEVLRHVDRDEEWERQRQSRGKRSRRNKDMEYDEGYFSRETLAIVSLAVFFIVAIIFAIRKTELQPMSVPVVGIISVILALMGFFVSSTPAFVPLMFSCIILLVGVFTGMLSEVMVGLVIFLGVILTVKEKIKG